MEAVREVGLELLSTEAAVDTSTHIWQSHQIKVPSAETRGPNLPSAGRWCHTATRGRLCVIAKRVIETHDVARTWQEVTTRFVVSREKRDTHRDRHRSPTIRSRRKSRTSQ